MKVSKLEFMPVVTSKLQFMVCVEDNVIFVTASNTLYHFNKRNSEKVKGKLGLTHEFTSFPNLRILILSFNYIEIDVNKSLGYNCKIKSLFVDPISGNHILLSVIPQANVNSSPVSTNAACDLIYLSPSSSGFKFKLVSNFLSIRQ